MGAKMRESLSMREMAERAMEGGVLGIEPPRPGQQSQELVWRQVYPPQGALALELCRMRGRREAVPVPSSFKGVD